METTLSAAVIPAGLSYPDFLEWLDEDIRAEWVDGEIIVMSPASRLHQGIASFLTATLKLYVEPRNLGEVIPAPFQMRTGKGLPGRDPDLIFVGRDRLSVVKETFVDGPADLVIEILSQESRTRDTVEKFAEYQQGGVREYWIIDPENREARFFAFENGAFSGIPVRKNIFESRSIPGLWIDLSWLWSIPTPSILEVQEAWERVLD